MYQFEVNAALLLTLVSGALALAFDYFPPLAKWFEELTSAAKRGVNALGVIGTGLLLFAGQCVGIFLTNLVCSWLGFFDLLYILFLAISVNQGVHLLLKPSPRVKARILGLQPPITK
jgi:hypothetical protein